MHRDIEKPVPYCRAPSKIFICPGHHISFPTEFDSLSCSVNHFSYCQLVARLRRNRVHSSLSQEQCPLYHFTGSPQSRFLAFSLPETRKSWFQPILHGLKHCVVVYCWDTPVELLLLKTPELQHCQYPVSTCSYHILKALLRTAFVDCSPFLASNYIIYQSTVILKM